VSDTGGDCNQCEVIAVADAKVDTQDGR